MSKYVCSKNDLVCLQNQIGLIVVAKSYLHAKLTEFFFLIGFKVALDCLVIELAAHLVEVSVQVKTFNRQIQSGDSGSEYVFGNSKTFKPLTDVKKAFTSARRKAGI